MAGSVPLGGSGQDLVSTQQNGVRYLGQLVQLFKQLLSRPSGTFTMPAAATFAVSSALIQAGQMPVLQATNAAAATLMGSAKSLYISSVSAGTGFTVATGNAANAVGTETFSWTV